MHRPPHICIFKISEYWVFSKQCRPGGMLKMTVVSCAAENLPVLVVYWTTLISRSLSQTKHSKTTWGRNGSPGSVPDLPRWRWHNQETACVRTYIMCISSLERKEQSGEQNTDSQPWRQCLLQSAGYAGGSPQTLEILSSHGGRENLLICLHFPRAHPQKLIWFTDANAFIKGPKEFPIYRK